MRCWFETVFLLSTGIAAVGGTYPLRDAVECRPRGGLPNVFAKLAAGESVKIAYLGGSITAAPGWRPKTLAWFRKQYPKAKVDEIHAAIGGTGSNLGVYRLGFDVLRHKPDLVFVEFAVNDGGADPSQIHRAMEGIIRQTWKQDPTIDICYVYTLTINMLKELQDGKFPRAASAMEALADHYAIPSIHVGMEVAKREKAGTLIFKADPKTAEEKAMVGDKMIFSRDGVHPHVHTGHEIYLEVVARSMMKIKEIGKPSPHDLGKPFAADNWEQAAMIPVDRAKMEGTWEKLDPKKHTLAKRFANRMPALWKTNSPGASIRFRFKGTSVGFYDLLGPDCGQVIVKIDNKPAKIRPRIDHYCTYHRISMLTLESGLANEVHDVHIELHADQPDKAKIMRGNVDLKKSPKKYNDRAWYVGGILLIGELTE